MNAQKYHACQNVVFSPGIEDVPESFQTLQSKLATQARVIIKKKNNVLTRDCRMILSLILIAALEYEFIYIKAVLKISF